MCNISFMKVLELIGQFMKSLHRALSLPLAEITAASGNQNGKKISIFLPNFPMGLYLLASFCVILWHNYTFLTFFLCTLSLLPLSAFSFFSHLVCLLHLFLPLTPRFIFHFNFSASFLLLCLSKRK